MRTKSSTIMLEACTFYFVKLITKFTEWSDYLKCTIERKNGSYWHNVEKTNLFWVLPGIKMYIELFIVFVCSISYSDL
jgi:hypothetical protein